MVTGPRATENTYPLFLYQKNLRYEVLKNRVFVLGLFKQVSNAHSCARSANIKKIVP